MKINKIEQSYTNIGFKAGKVKVFSDFDKTFLPAKHKEFARYNDKKFIDKIENYFKNFKKFLNNTREGLNFTITTGRTFGEFLTMAEIARNRNFEMPLPDSLIVKNGSDEHLRVGTDEEFYKGGAFPFRYEITNKEKENKLKELTGWDGVKAKKIIKDVLNSFNLRIVEADSENSASDYGTRSLFSAGNLKDESKCIFDNVKQSELTAGLRRDGNLKVTVVYPTGLNHLTRTNLIMDIDSKIRSELRENNIGFERLPEHDCKNRPVETYLPTKKLTKHYDPAEALLKAKKNNDLVIVAGDSSNDIPMLNPGLYLEHFLTPEQKKKYLHTLYGVNDGDLVKELDSKDNAELAKIYKEMPFVGIIVKHSDGENELTALDAYTKGKYKKVIVVDEANLENGIKDAIKLYSEQNPNFKKELSKDLEKEVYSSSNGDNKINNNGNKEGDKGENKEKPENDDGDSP